jgi:hypothetical protein
MKTHTQRCTLGVEGAPAECIKLLRLAPLLLRTRLTSGVPAGVRVVLTPHERQARFQVERGQLRVSTWQSGELAGQAGLSVGYLYLLCAVLALVQWRALQRNPLLVAEDFLHTEPATCLYACHTGRVSQHLALARLSICRPCVEFYACLGAERELEELQRLLTLLRKPVLN